MTEAEHIPMTEDGCIYCPMEEEYTTYTTCSSCEYCQFMSPDGTTCLYSAGLSLTEFKQQAKKDTLSFAKMSILPEEWQKHIELARFLIFLIILTPILVFNLPWWVFFGIIPMMILHSLCLTAYLNKRVSPFEEEIPQFIHAFLGEEETIQGEEYTVTEAVSLYPETVKRIGLNSLRIICATDKKVCTLYVISGMVHKGRLHKTGSKTYEKYVRRGASIEDIL